MVIIDGSEGEGGGQILRTALALSVLTGKPFRAIKVRAGREKPGLLRQHLTAVQAAARVGQAAVTGAAIGSQELTFEPYGNEAGHYSFAVGTAGSVMLVLQTILPPLLVSARPTELVLEGGTHNPLAPPFDFLTRTFLPLIQRMGPRIEAKLERPGFFPAGGGRCTVRIEPVRRLEPLELLQRGQVKARRARVLLAHLPHDIAQREIAVLKKKLSWPEECFEVEELNSSIGPGNAVVLELECEHIIEVFSGFGMRGLRAEAVAEQCAAELREYVARDVPVGEYLADQLLLPLVMAGNGSYVTGPLSPHTATNIQTIQKFIDRRIQLTPGPNRSNRISVAD